MKLLLDTHILIWFVNGDARLSAAARRAIESAEERLLSAASIWEIAIKASLGKLTFDRDLEPWIDLACRRTVVEVLAVDARHALATAALPWHHRDPFDRLLVAQAMVERATLVSADPKMVGYGVDLIA